MRRTIHTLAAVLLLLPFTVLAQPGSGKQWEVKMKLPGMSEQDIAEYEAAMKDMPPGMTIPGMPQFQGGMMVQQHCLPAEENEPPPANEDCTLLEQRSSGNKHHVKMRCPDGTIELDQTRTDTTMNTHMKMTDNKGVVSEMDMTGRLLGECDYTAEVDSRRRQVAAMEKQVEDAQRQSKEQLAAVCKESLEKMQGHVFAQKDMCTEADRKEFCRRANTREGYSVFRRQFGAGAGASAAGHGPDDQLKACATTEAKVLAKLCPQARAENDFRFVADYCPNERTPMCPAAEKREELWYIDRYCVEARAGLIAKHCAGRKFSSQIDPKYRDFCAGALGRDLKGGDTQGSGAAGGEQPEPPEQPADPVQQGVKKGVEGLKKVFGF